MHAIEGLLELISTDPWVFKPAELYKIDGPLREQLTRYNLYLVARRQRLSIDQSSLAISDSQEEISGNFVVHIQDEKKYIPFTYPCPIEGKVTQIGLAEYPHSYLRFIVNDVHPVQIRLHDILRFSVHKLGKYADLKIEYVGQSFGTDGSSDAMQRLIGKTGKQGHGCLQKVLADINEKYPDQEAHILLYSYEEYKNYIHAGGAVQPTYDFDHDENRFENLMTAKYSRDNRIDLAEATLIRYFEPIYNDTYKKTFPKKTHDMLQSLFEYDVTGLAVSISTLEHNLRIYSDKVSASNMHCPQFSILKDSERASFLDLTMKYA